LQVLRAAQVLQQGQQAETQLMLVQDVIQEQERLVREGIARPDNAAARATSKAYHMYAASAYPSKPAVQEEQQPEQRGGTAAGWQTTRLELLKKLSEMVHQQVGGGQSNTAAAASTQQKQQHSQHQDDLQLIRFLLNSAQRAF
jgi:hypothetical protein